MLEATTKSDAIKEWRSITIEIKIMTDKIPKTVLLLELAMYLYVSLNLFGYL